MSTEDKIFEKLDDLGKLYAKLDKSVEVLKMREQPSFPCRAYMSIIEKEAELKREEIKTDINNLGIKVSNKIDTSWFKWIVGTCFAFAAGAYFFTWSCFW